MEVVTRSLFVSSLGSTPLVPLSRLVLFLLLFLPSQLPSSSAPSLSPLCGSLSPTRALILDPLPGS